MVLLAIHDRRVEIETGYGIEGILPDGKAGEMIRTAMLPSFTHDRWGEGLVAGTQRVAQRLLEQAHTLHPPAESRHPSLAARNVVYWIGWGYFVGWLGFLLTHRVRHHILSSRVLALITVPGVGFVVWAFIPFIVPFLIGLVPLVANVRARCPTCGGWLSRRKRTVRTPTRDKLRETVYDCLACGYHDVQLAIPGRRAWSGSGGPGYHGWSGGVGSYGVSSSGGGQWRRFQWQRLLRRAAELQSQAEQLDTRLPRVVVDERAAAVGIPREFVEQAIQQLTAERTAQAM